MMRRGLFFCLIGGLFGVLGCALKKMPEGDLVSVEFSRYGTMARPEFEGHVEQDSTGAFVLTAMKETYGPLFEKKVDTDVMKHFRQIIEEEKMYNYKESYKPSLDVLDGWRLRRHLTRASTSVSERTRPSPQETARASPSLRATVTHVSSSATLRLCSKRWGRLRAGPSPTTTPRTSTTGRFISRRQREAGDPSSTSVSLARRRAAL